MKNHSLRRLGLAKDMAGTTVSLSACLDMVLAQTPALLDDVLQGVQTQIQQRQAMQGVATANPVYFASVNLAPVELLQRFEAQFELFRGQFVQHLQEQVRHGGEKKNLPQRVRFDDVLLLEDEQIDANIEQALTEQAISQAVRERVEPVHALISSLMGWVTVQGQFNPIRPENYAHALRRALVDALGEEDARNSSLQVMLATVLGHSLSELYADLAACLRSLGVEPLVPVNAFVSPTAAPNKVQRTLLTMDKLRRLLTQEIHLFPAQQDFSHTVPCSVEALEDLKLVDALMQRLGERAQQAGPLDSPMTLEEMHASQQLWQGRQLGQQLGHEVVHLMLEHLSQDGRLPLPVRLALADLEGVLGRLSEQDPRFFSDKTHPARLFLERITHRSLGFRHLQDLDYVAFQSMLDSTVQSLRAGPVDASAFAQHLQQLEARWAAQDATVRAQAQAAARDLVVQEQRDLLASKWAQDHAQQVGSRPVPLFVQQFLQGPWAQVLAQAQMRGSEAAAELESYQELVRKLIWSTQLSKVQKYPGRLMRMVPRMLMTLRQGLQTIDFPDALSKEFLDSLIAVHEQAFDALRAGAEPMPEPSEAVQDIAEPELVELPEELSAPSSSADAWAVSAAAPLQTDADQSMYVPPQDVQVPTQPDPALQASWSADQLMPGAWVDLAWNGQWLRAQLHWASPHRTLFMFVSAGGLSHTMSRRTMARLRGLGLLRLVSDGHVMDNALDAVAQVALHNDIQAHRKQR